MQRKVASDFITSQEQVYSKNALSITSIGTLIIRIGNSDMIGNVCGTKRRFVREDRHQVIGLYNSVFCDGITVVSLE